MHAAAVSERLSDFGNADVVLVTFTEPDKLAAYLEHRQLSYPVVIDTDRSTYQAFGLERGSVPRVWGLRSAKRYMEIIRDHGFGVFKQFGSPTEDTLQLGGDFVIDPDGTLIYGYWSTGPDDRPGIDELLKQLPSS